MNIIKSMGFNVFSDNLDLIPINNGENCIIINTISPNSYGISTKDAHFKEALKNSDYLVLDGVYFALSSIIFQGKNIQKNQAPEMFYHFMKRMNDTNGKVFFLGASNETLEKIKIITNNKYPNINIGVYSPPFKDEFSKQENIEMINAINNFNPDILFVGMTCPKQEKWAYQNKHNFRVKLVCCIGAVFDWYAGNQKEIHPLWWKLRLGWLKRTIDRPEILKRYPNIGIYFWHLILAILGIKNINKVI